MTVVKKKPAVKKPVVEPTVHEVQDLCERLAMFHLPKDYLISETHPFNVFTPAEGLDVSVYQEQGLWTTTIAYNGELLSLSRGSTERSNVYKLALMAGLKAVLTERWDLADFIMRTFIDILERYQSGFMMVTPHSVEVPFTDTHEGVTTNGYLVFTEKGGILAHGFADDTTRNYIEKFGHLYADFNARCARIRDGQSKRLPLSHLEAHINSSFSL